MAVRLNIENEFWDDPRFDKLESLFAREPGLQPYAHYLRIGAAAYLWKVAQKYATAEGSIIPEAILSSIEAYPKLIEANVIVKQANGYFVEGSRKHLGWIGLRRDGGKKGGASKSAKKTKSLKKPRSSPEAKTSLPEAYEASTETSYSSSFSLSSSISNPLPGELTDGQQAQQVIALYCRLWKDRYGANPDFSGKWAGNAKTLIKDHGMKRAQELVSAFLKMTDQNFLNRRHDFSMMMTDLAKVSHFAGTGVVVTQTQLRQFDQTQTNEESFRLAEERLAAKRAGVSK